MASTLEKILQGGAAPSTTANNDSYTADTSNGNGNNVKPLDVTPPPSKDSTAPTNTNINVGTSQMPATGAGATKKDVGAAPTPVPLAPTDAPMTGGINKTKATTPDVLPKIPKMQQGQVVKDDGVQESKAATKEGASEAPITKSHKYADIFQRINQYRTPTLEEQAQTARRERSNRIIAALGDGITALANVYNTTKGANNMYTPSESLSAAYQDRYEQMRKQREAERDNYLNGYVQATKMDENADDKEEARRDAEANRKLREAMMQAENDRYMYGLQAKTAINDANNKSKDAKWAYEQKNKAAYQNAQLGMAARRLQLAQWKASRAGALTPKQMYDMQQRQIKDNYHFNANGKSGEERDMLDVPKSVLTESKLSDIVRMMTYYQNSPYRKIADDIGIKTSGYGSSKNYTPTQTQALQFIERTLPKSYELQAILHDMAGVRNPYTGKGDQNAPNPVNKGFNANAYKRTAPKPKPASQPQKSQKAPLN